MNQNTINLLLLFGGMTYTAVFLFLITVIMVMHKDIQDSHKLLLDLLIEIKIYNMDK